MISGAGFSLSYLSEFPGPPHTSNLVQRVWQHKGDLAQGFTRRYGVHALVWYEAHVTMESAIVREKRIKDWKRSWKIALIEESNPRWRDLYEELG
ncbi:MAG: GIY-YIG nuclease family protein [Dehalococcoidia bacterium]|nr:GIY-YIG nuclease family protein [Dehalococcoidia bacterium]